MNKTSFDSPNTQEGALIGALLVFANLRRVKSVSQVHNLFSRLPFVESPEQFKMLRDDETHVFVAEQARLRKWLDDIIRSGADRQRVGQEIDAVLARTASARFRLEDGKRRMLLRLDGVEACLSYALSLILDESAGLAGRLQRCDAPGCGRYRLDLVTKGRPGRWCSREHRVMAQVVREREERQAQRRERERKRLIKEKLATEQKIKRIDAQLHGIKQTDKET